MRRPLTEPERKLWQAPRQRLPQDGTRFRRQVPIGPYIVDFCRVSRALVVEVDGAQHGTDQAITYDAARTRVIETQGFHVLRFSNMGVMTAIESVLDTIFAHLEKDHPAYV